MTVNYIKSTRETRGKSPISHLLQQQAPNYVKLLWSRATVVALRRRSLSRWTPLRARFFFRDELQAIKFFSKNDLQLVDPGQSLRLVDPLITLVERALSVKMRAPFSKDFFLRWSVNPVGAGHLVRCSLRLSKPREMPENPNTVLLTIPVWHCAYHNVKNCIFSWQIQCQKCINLCK